MPGVYICTAVMSQLLTDIQYHIYNIIITHSSVCIRCYSRKMSMQLYLTVEAVSLSERRAHAMFLLFVVSALSALCVCMYSM